MIRVLTTVTETYECVEHCVDYASPIAECYGVVWLQLPSDCPASDVALLEAKRCNLLVRSSLGPRFGNVDIETVQATIDEAPCTPVAQTAVLLANPASDHWSLHTTTTSAPAPCAALSVGGSTPESERGRPEGSQALGSCLLVVPLPPGG